MGPKMELPGGAVLGLHALSALLRTQAQCSVPHTHRMTAGYWEPIIQSEVSQKEKQQYSILTHIYGI